VLRLENSFSVLVELARTQSERMDEYEHRSEELAGAQIQTQARLEELAEAQKQTGVHLEELAEAQKQTGVRLEALAEAQKQTEAHISVLAQVMAELGRAQARTEGALTSLAERFDEYISRS
jgi:chromosome segregation ATPase